MIKAIIFDMDGVVINSEDYWIELEREYAESKGVKFSDEYKKEVTGTSQDDIIKLLREKYGVEDSVEKMEEERNKLGQEIYDKKANLIPGFLDLVEKIKSSKRYKIGLATSSPWRWINIVIKRLNIKKYFDVIVSADDLQGKGKPAPDIYLFIARKLGMSPEECLAIEDAVNGVKSAKTARMACIALESDYTNDKDLKDAGADIIVRSLREINSKNILSF